MWYYNTLYCMILQNNKDLCVTKRNIQKSAVLFWYTHITAAYIRREKKEYLEDRRASGFSSLY